MRSPVRPINFKRTADNYVCRLTAITGRHPTASGLHQTLASSIQWLHTQHEESFPPFPLRTLHPKTQPVSILRTAMWHTAPAQMLSGHNSALPPAQAPVYSNPVLNGHNVVLDPLPHSSLMLRSSPYYTKLDPTLPLRPWAHLVLLRVYLHRRWRKLRPMALRSDSHRP